MHGKISLSVTEGLGWWVTEISIILILKLVSDRIQNFLFRVIDLVWQGWEFAHSFIAHSGIRSDRSRQMNHCEPIALVSHDKRATVSDSLRSLSCSQKNLTKIVFLYVFLRFLKFKKTSDSLIPSFFKRCERIAQVAHQNWACEKMRKSLVFLANRSFAHFFAKNERSAQKTNERIPNPGF